MIIVLLVLVVAVGCGVVFVLSLRKTPSLRDATNELRARLMTTGIPIRGRIVDLQPSWKPYGYTALNVVVDLEATPGMAPRRIVIDSLVSPMQRACYQPGLFCDLRIDPQNPHQIVIVGIHVNGVVVVPKY